MLSIKYSAWKWRWESYVYSIQMWFDSSFAPLLLCVVYTAHFVCVCVNSQYTFDFKRWLSVGLVVAVAAVALMVENSNIINWYLSEQFIHRHQIHFKVTEILLNNRNLCAVHACESIFVCFFKCILLNFKCFSCLMQPVWLVRSNFIWPPFKVV